MSQTGKININREFGDHLDGYDIGVIVVYFIFMLLIGIWSSRHNKGGNMSEYFLAARRMTWIPVGASIFSTNISSTNFIGLAGGAASTGIGVAGYELGSLFILMILAYVFVPVYISSGIYTLPEYLSQRFGGERIRIYLSFFFLLICIFTRLSGDIYAGALFIQFALNRNSAEWLYIGSIIILAMSALFTISGGLVTVMWTDTIQAIVIVIGGLVLTGIAFKEVGGFDNLVNEFPYAIAKHRAGNGTCGIPPDDYMNLLRSAIPGESDLPWTGMVFGLTIIAIWFWCADQIIVQRTLASKDVIHAKGGCIFAAYLKILPLFLTILPGMISRVLFPETVACSDPDECFAVCRSKYGCSNIAYVELVMKLLPSGLSGLMFAVMMAALVSSITSIFNSASTIFSIDVWTRFRRKATDLELLVVGRVFIIILATFTVLWIPVIQNSKNSKLFDYLVSINSFLAPPVCAVFLLAVFSERTNESGAFSGLMIGLIVGMIRFILEFAYPPPACGEVLMDTRPEIIILLVDRVHFLHFACILFLITVLTTVAVSYLTPPIPKESVNILSHVIIN